MLFSFIISSIFTLTVASKSEVTPSGSLPAHVEYVYANTYKGGQLTAGNTATLTLTGLRDTEIQRITLKMHSNQSSGAGRLVATCGGRTVWEITDAPFSNGAWGGSYSSTDVDITHAFETPLVAGNDPLEIEVAASVNSLYISSYTIEYTAAKPRTYTVSFSVPTGGAPAPLTETAVGSGIVLPNVDYEEDGWRFLGWTTAPMPTMSYCSLFLHAGEVYYPAYDATLYALYTNRETVETIAPSRPENGGVYVLALPSLKLIASGVLEDNYWSLVSGENVLKEQDGVLVLCTDRVDEKVMYALSIEQDTLVYISSYQDASPIGFEDGKLKAQQSVWVLRERGMGDYDLLAKEKGGTQRLYVGLKTIGGVQYMSMVLGPQDETKQGLLFYDMSANLEASAYSSYPPGYEQGWKSQMVEGKVRKILRDGRLLIVAGERTMDVLGQQY